MPLSTGDHVAPIRSRNHEGSTVEVSFEEPTVLYFYPRDDTPGCTTEAQQFDAELDTYRDAGVAVYGVSTDGVEAHRAFREKYDLDLQLLADPDGELAEQFGVEIQQNKAARTTFVLADGRVQAVYTGVKPDGHARSVLADMLDEGIVEVEW